MVHVVLCSIIIEKSYDFDVAVEIFYLKNIKYQLYKFVGEYSIDLFSKLEEILQS